MSLNAENIAPILDANWFKTSSSKEISHISIDSRSMQNGVETLFFALVGPNNNGHNYIAELIQKGVRNFVIEAKEFKKSIRLKWKAQFHQ
mgnify:CR=1 FL=1